MPDVDPTPIVLGLYRHDVPETETLRAVLDWLRHHSTLVDPITAQLSIEASKELLREFHIDQALEQLGPGASPWDVMKLVLASVQPQSAATVDDALINRIVASNDRFPQRIRLLTHHVGCCPITVGYEDAVPDNFREAGRRMIQISASPPDYLFADVLLPLRLPFDRSPAPEDLPAYLLDAMEHLLRECAQNVHLDYATIQRGRELPNPVKLPESVDPADFDRSYVSLCAAEISSILLEYADLSEWSLHPLPFGIYFRLRDEDGEASWAGRDLCQRLSAILAERFGKA